jgi:hypothetical protein
MGFMAAPQSVTREEHFLVIFFYSTLGYGTYNPAPIVASSGSWYPVLYGCPEINSGIRGNKKSPESSAVRDKNNYFPEIRLKNERIYLYSPFLFCSMVIAMSECFIC